MGQETTVDQLYSRAEALSQNFSLFPRRTTSAVIQGLISEQEIDVALENLRNMDVDAYIASTVSPCEEAARPSAREILRSFRQPVQNEISNGPFYSAEMELDFGDYVRRVGFICQDRRTAMGVWGAEHHEQAAQVASQFAIRSMPIICFMDTPGADGKEDANAANQAHSISRLIAELCNVDVPTLGVIIGQGYSGGAIPLAASNLLVSLRTGVFNTIHPKGLANLVRRYNLSWQECAQFVGVSSYELYRQGNIDGIVDYDPGEDHKLDNLRSVIISGITSIEQSCRTFVAEHPEILQHYQQNLNRYFNRGEYLAAVDASSTLKLRTSPTEYPNVFGVAFRYLRYLGLRRRIKSTTIGQYGRLAVDKMPEGKLAEREIRERRVAFLSWLQDPDQILYEDHLSRSWKIYAERKQQLGGERGRLAQLIFGEPGERYEAARGELCLTLGMHLYNRWKAQAEDNFLALINHINHRDASRFLLRSSDVRDVKALLREMSASNHPFLTHVKGRFGYDGKKLFDSEYLEEKGAELLGQQLVIELNLVLEGEPFYPAFSEKDISMSELTRQVILRTDASTIELNRRILEDNLWSFIERREDGDPEGDDQNRTVLDIVLDEDIGEPFIESCKNLIAFGEVYNTLIGDLVGLASQTQATRLLPATFIDALLDTAFLRIASMPLFEGGDVAELKARFARWVQSMAGNSRSSQFYKAVEEWIRVVHKDKSDTLFVVITFFFEKLLPHYYQAREGGRTYEGKVEPARIGRRKDFWNRLTIAYRDLLFAQILDKEKKSRATTYKTLLNRYVDNFTERHGELMSANPVDFPTFRPSIESALQKDVKPHGLITGIGDFKTDQGSYRVGLVMSNVEFQVGCIDNSDCVRFCKLLVECAQERIPVIGFISSGGMQTKEGAAALFTMAVVNDRLTRFVRDNDLPVIMFGFGDCTGGAQASFVTHPLVQSYYFSCTSMPFAGQAVVESNLPFTCLLSNYLSVTQGSMRGLVKLPFSNLDDDLRSVDPSIPLPTETVEEVVDRVMSGTLTAADPTVAKPRVSEEELFRPVQRTLVHARGCTAVKLVTKAIEYGHEVVLVQSDPDMGSVAADLVRDNDKHALVCIGGNTSDESYLNAMSVLSIADAEGVDSLHPGIGFLSEEANFARLVRNQSLNFIGPRVSSMETMSNKSNAINTTMSIGVPVVPGSHGIVNSSEQAAEIADDVGYPVLLKAVQGGGGKGIQIVERPEELHSLFQLVSTEAKAAFGNGDLYIEKFVTSMRHIEAQVLRDTHGNTRVLGIRDCSVQRNNQKLIEESGSTLLPAHLREQVMTDAAKIADAVDYVGAGTVEFIYDVPSNSTYFMEMNTRLQVEHPVTEVTTDTDIVRKQFEIAGGGSIEDLNPSEQGYGMEVRVNAEKAVLNARGEVSFQPTPGEITVCEIPEEDHIRVISMAGEGKVVPPFYDSLIIQIICYGKDRTDTIDKLVAYLGRVVINGVSTNLSLIKRILRDETFRGGDYDTGYLPGFLSQIDAVELIAEIDEAAGSTGQVIDLNMVRIEDSNELKVLSPSTGVFYLTPSPTEPEYVNVGDTVSVDDTLCQLEAMKMFTPVNLNTFSGDAGELYPDRRYTISRINLTSGQQVNEGDLLFVIRPVEAA